jgi:choline kinase
MEKLHYITMVKKLIGFGTIFKHKDSHKFTWEARRHKSIIDYFITHIKTSKVIQNIRVYRSNELVTIIYYVQK